MSAPLLILALFATFAFEASAKNRRPAQAEPATPMKQLNKTLPAASTPTKKSPPPATTQPAGEVNRAMAIRYGSNSWNKDSGKIDSAYLIMRDKESGKLVQVQIEETEPDSSEFAGKFSVTLGKNEKTNPEVYVPPQDKDTAKALQAIQSGQLSKKPIVVKKKENGHTELDVYDTKEQAQAALKAYNESERLKADLEKKKLLKPLTSDAALEAAKQMERQKLLDQMAADAAKRASDRIRLEQIEKQKAAEREAAMRALSEKEKAERRARAKKMGQEAMALFEAGDFTGAAAKFKASVEADPEDTSYYFKYGVTLYRLEKYNDALVMLKLAKVDGATEPERRYFMGLTHYRLKELDNSVAQFNHVIKSGNSSLAPSASFYRGVVYFTQEKYDDSKKDFETVIDTSSDPRMDEQAESYLDQIASALIYKKLQENKFTFMGILGGMYDSNILLSPDNTDQGAATKVSDFRLVTIADLEYRPIYQEKKELSVKGNFTMINSLKEDAAKADPYLTNLAVPYSYKGVIWGKGAKLTAKPAYELLVMDPSGTGTKKPILSSLVGNFDAVFVMSQTWFAGYTVELRSDDSLTADSAGAEDSDAMRISLKTTQTMFLDKAKKEALIPSFGYVMNAAKGDNKKYSRIEGGVSYSRPTFWESSWSASLALYKLDYSQSDDSRSDLNTTLSLSLSKPIRDWVTWGMAGSYSKNDSNVDANEYSKFTVMTTATFVKIF